MAPAASWLIVCLFTVASGARLPGGEEPDPGQQPPTAPWVALPGDQRHDLNIYSSRGSGPTREAVAVNDAHDHVGETSSRRTFVFGESDAETAVRGGSSDNNNDDDRKKKHDPHAGYGDGGGDGHEEDYFSHTGYGSDDYYKEYSYYDHQGYGGNGYDHKHGNNTHFLHIDDGGENSEKELLYWFEAFRNQGTNCSEIGDGIHLCYEDYNEDTDESGKCDNKDCDHSEGRLTAYFERDEDEDEGEGKGGKHDTNTLDEEYLISVKELDGDDDDDKEDNDYNDDDDDVDDAMDDGDDDGDDIYLVLESNDTNLLSLLNITLDPELELPPTTQIENDSAFRGPENEDSSSSGEGESVKISPHVSREEIVVLSDKQPKGLGEVACRGVGCRGGAVDDGEAGEGDENDASRVDASSVFVSANMVQPDLYFSDDTPTIARKDKIDMEYISQNELKELLKEFEDSIITENEAWETAMHTADLTSGWIENSTVPETANTNSRSATEAITEYNEDLHFKISNHKTTPSEEGYDLIMRSGQVSDKDKNYISSLEQLRRLVNRFGGLGTLLKKPEVHHIVKRQVSGTEACVFLRRRRRRAAGEAGEAGERKRASRARRGVTNIGRNLEQGNPRFRQLFSQYEAMCDFLSLSVFEK